MKRGFLIFLIVLGAVLILASALLVGFNIWQGRHAGESARQGLQEVRAYIAEACPEITPTASAAPAGEAEDDSLSSGETLPEITIGDQDYIGYLSLTPLGLELPVISQWSYPALVISPCRQAGTPEEGDLVIAAHNFPEHFGRIHELSPGDEFSFTDMYGKTFRYTVGTVETIQPFEDNRVLGTDWDIVLYTCTVGGRQRVMVGASRIPETPAASPAP